MDKFNIANLAKGALIEQAEGEIQKVIDNIADPNTDCKKARKVTITLTFKPIDESRELATIDIQTKSSVVPYDSVRTNICLGKDNEGNVIAEEYTKGTIAGQTAIDIDYDTGEILNESKVVKMNK